MPGKSFEPFMKWGSGTPSAPHFGSTDKYNGNEEQLMLIFEWDLKKAKTNLKNHGVSFEEASTAFKDPLSLTIDDPLHSSDEERLILIGMSYYSHMLVISSY